MVADHAFVVVSPCSRPAEAGYQFGVALAKRLRHRGYEVHHGILGSPVRIPHGSCVVLNLFPSSLLYSPRCLAHLVGLLLIVRLRRSRLHCVAHEHYPSRGESVGAVSLHWATRIVRRTILRSSDRIVVTEPIWRENALRHCPDVRTARVPPLPDVSLPARKVDATAGHRGCTVVGSLHPGKGTPESETAEVLRILTKHGAPKITILGGLAADAEKVRTLLGANCDEVVIVATGKLTDEEFVEGLQNAEVAVALFDNGISGRRSSAALALQCGVPIVTTWGKASEDVYRSCSGIHLWNLPLPSNRSSALTGWYTEAHEGRSVAATLFAHDHLSWDSMVDSVLP